MATTTQTDKKKDSIESSMNDEAASLDEKLQMLQDRAKDVSDFVPSPLANWNLLRLVPSLTR